MSRRLLAVFLFAAALLIGCLVFLRQPSAKGTTPLTVYCAAGIKKPVEAIAQAYEDEFGVVIQLQYGLSLIHI